MASVKSALRTVADGSMWVLVTLLTSAAVTSMVVVLTLPYWKPWIEKEVLTVCKDYHATQTALESSQAWTLPSGQVIPPRIPMETPFK